MADSILIIPLSIIYYCEIINVFFYGKSERVEDGRSTACSHRRGVDRCLILAPLLFMKYYFQHDFNCSQKDGFAALLKLPNGDALYGKFWLLHERFCQQQQGRKTFRDTVEINEGDLCRAIKCNRRNLDKVLETFWECLGIVTERIPKRFGNVITITMPNALLYMTNRSKKVGNIKEKENKSENPIIEAIKKGKIEHVGGRTVVYVGKEKENSKNN